MFHDDYCGCTYSFIDSKKLIISLATVSLLWFGSSPSLTPMCEKASFVVFEDRLMRLINIDSLVLDKNIMFMEYCNF